MNTRFLNSVIATAQTTNVQMPWHRALRAERRAAEVKVVQLSQYRATVTKRAA